MPCLDSEECQRAGERWPCTILGGSAGSRVPCSPSQPRAPVSVSDLQQPPSGSGEKGLSSFTGGLGCGWCP